MNSWQWSKESKSETFRRWKTKILVDWTPKKWREESKMLLKFLAGDLGEWRYPFEDGVK